MRLGCHQWFKSLILLFIPIYSLANTATIADIYEVVIENRYINNGFSALESKQLAKETTKSILSSASKKSSSLYSIAAKATWYSTIAEFLLYAPELNSNEVTPIEFLMNSPDTRIIAKDGKTFDFSKWLAFSHYEGTVVKTYVPTRKDVFIMLPSEMSETGGEHYIVAIQPLDFESSNYFRFRSLMPVDHKSNYCYANSSNGMRACYLAYSGSFNDEETSETRTFSLASRKVLEDMREVSGSEDVFADDPRGGYCLLGCTVTFTKDYTRYDYRAENGYDSDKVIELNGGEDFSILTFSSWNPEEIDDDEYESLYKNKRTPINTTLGVIKEHFSVSNAEIEKYERGLLDISSDSYKGTSGIPSYGELYNFAEHEVYGKTELELMKIPFSFIEVPVYDHDDYNAPIRDSLSANSNKEVKESYIEKYVGSNPDRLLITELSTLTTHNKALADKNYISDDDFSKFINNSADEYYKSAPSTSISNRNAVVSPSNPVTAREVEEARSSLNLTSVMGIPLSKALHNPINDVNKKYYPERIAADTGETAANNPTFPRNDDIAPPVTGNSGTASPVPNINTGSGSTSIPNIGSTTGSHAGTVTSPVVTVPTEKDEEKINDFLIPEPPSANEILEPLLNISKLAEKLKINGHSGTCPTFNMDMFDRTFVLDSHCIILDKVGGILENLAMLVWFILAGIIILKA